MALVHQRFEEIMSELYSTVVKATSGRYKPTSFNKMVLELGGLPTAKSLLESTEPQLGLARLWQFNRLDLSVEFNVLQPQFATLFTSDERMSARKRLATYGYNINGDGTLVKGSDLRIPFEARFVQVTP